MHLQLIWGLDWRHANFEWLDQEGSGRASGIRWLTWKKVRNPWWSRCFRRCGLNRSKFNMEGWWLKDRRDGSLKQCSDYKEIVFHHDGVDTTHLSSLLWISQRKLHQSSSLSSESKYPDLVNSEWLDGRWWKPGERKDRFGWAFGSKGFAGSNSLGCAGNRTDA